MMVRESSSADRLSKKPHWHLLSNSKYMRSWRHRFLDTGLPLPHITLSSKVLLTIATMSYLRTFLATTEEEAMKFNLSRVQNNSFFKRMS